MPHEADTAIASDAEIEAALTEAGSHAARIPSLDDGVEQPPKPAQTMTPPAVIGPGTQAGGAVGTALPGHKGPLQNVPSAPKAQGPAAGSASRQRQPAPAGDVRPVPAPAGVVYRAVDASLMVINRPFGRIRAEVRQLVGLLAAVSIIVSVLALLFVPVLFPARDAISQLRQRVLQVRSGPAPAASSASEMH